MISVARTDGLMDALEVLTQGVAALERRNMEHLSHLEGIKILFALNYVEFTEEPNRPSWINKIESFLLAAAPKEKKQKC